MRISDWISDVFSSDLGVLPLPSATLATNADPAVRAAWLEAMFLPPDAFDWPLNVLVVRSGDQTILVDAGLGGEFPGFPRAGQFPQRLAADRKSVVSGKSVSVRVDLGGRRILKKQN